MKRFSVFGEYQLVFDLYPMCEFSPYIPSYNTSEEVVNQLGEDAEVKTFNVMCLEDEKFEELCELYEDSKTTIAHNGLQKRKLFMEVLERQKIAFQKGKKWDPYIYTSKKTKREKVDQSTARIADKEESADGSDSPELPTEIKLYDEE